MANTNKNTNELVFAKAGQLVCNDAVLRELQAQQRRTEDYADQLRRQLSDLCNDSKQAINDRDTLEIALACSEQKVDKLGTQLEAAKNTIGETTVAHRTG